jgi:hypothetical protein
MSTVTLWPPEENFKPEGLVPKEFNTLVPLGAIETAKPASRENADFSKIFAQLVLQELQ